jgi:hypothetical protein
MWTDRKNLKKLQEVQAQIHVLEELTSFKGVPRPSWKVKNCRLRDFYGQLSDGLDPNVEKLFIDSFNESDRLFVDHLQELGLYCLALSSNMRDYWENSAKLTKLKKEEKELKDRLGIS